MPLHVPTSSSGAFVLLEGVGDDEDDDEGEDEDEDDDDDDAEADDDDDNDVLFSRRACPHAARMSPSSPSRSC